MSESIKSKKKIAIVLFNLGGPDGPKTVQPFLFNLFNDKYIITLPKFLRFFIAKLISVRREKIAQKIYAYTGGKSPILSQTIAQKEALKKELKNTKTEEFEIFICMRHWHPMTREVIQNIEKFEPHEIIMLPLYPQFSTTTTLSSFEEFTTKLKSKDKIKLKAICCYPIDEKFIKAHAELIEENLFFKKDLSNIRILFSAHGLPARVIKNGDPYQWQIEQTVERIIELLSAKSQLRNLDYKITYQSRVGPLKWINPNTEDEIKLAAKEGKSLVIVPVSFVSEHVETLVELDIEYKKIADEAGVEYTRVPALSTKEMFIKSLAGMVSRLVKQDSGLLTSSKLLRTCPILFSKCPCKEEIKL